MDEHEHFPHDTHEKGDPFEIEITGSPQPMRPDDAGNSRLEPAEALLHRRLSRGQRFRRIAITLSILLLGLLVIVPGSYQALIAYLSALPSFLTGQPQMPLALWPEQKDFACLADVAWSPNGQRIALLGYRQNCALNHGAIGTVSLYDMRSGHLIARLQPDASIFHALKLLYATILPSASSSVAAVWVIAYQHVLWSPDGRRLALTFTLLEPPFLPFADSEVMREGLLLMDTDGSHVRVFLQPQTTAVAPAYAVWDLDRSTLQIALSLPPAAAYRWGVDGSLVPVPNAARLAQTPDPVGNPDGGSSFTVWQSGVAALVARRSPRSKSGYEPELYAWLSFFAAWSPNQRYLVTELAVQGQLQPVKSPSPPKGLLINLGISQAPLLPVHDAGFLRVLKTLPSALSSQNTEVLTVVAWRPDGRVVAAYNPGHNVTLYDCVTGRQLASLPLPQQSDNVPSQLFPVLRWSPDGSHLLLLDDHTGLLAIWGPQQLPK
jgi:WD40 repeat protein